ncbi:phosphonate metabolism protein/1,5-bisphosphokinase (PRPP-forming) PhnN [Paraburkholderia phosphatilytica]|uniref:phosphonate metabolism protein/1,5-bisphosphokinase (PRPP-forming) PhnN n=1 Tax=Paraburkholderia phosphatilytica TaxID=2282883 RepID=UPI000E48B315|nr:phosphonate metabolism protein/1,5-bisphosphokinase (PRPP-forming) PhnN [Paraburkholderia phosphatilytica]
MPASGVFFFVVGPSGAGKDTLIDGARAAFAARDGFVFATRTITRPSGAPGEAHIGVTEAEFATLEATQRFLITWHAHGLRYGLAASLVDDLNAGQHVIANGSRAAIPLLQGCVSKLVVIEVTAPAGVLAARIASRGRETAAEIAARLARGVAPMPDGIRAIKVMNDGSAALGIERFVATLEAVAHERADVTPSAGWDDFLAKRAGATLDEAAYRRLVDSIAAQRFTHDESADILRVLVTQLQDAEVGALARARTRRMPRLDWGEPIVVDKHSMGGVPGSRITLIVVPIVAAFGLLMPKTSSRAITSAAGTADSMEAIARVDLDPAEVRRVAHAARGCIAWNGRLNHSFVDDVTNAMVRPLQLDTRRWSVASILSKKYSAGATHVVIDLPYGPYAKLRDEREARELGDLFEQVGADLGMIVKAVPTDGREPIGRGIGPALELRDACAVLDNDAHAPTDLREKALRFAAYILAWSPTIGTVQQGSVIAAQLLASGAARRAFDRIVDAQGRMTRVEPSACCTDVVAEEGGIVTQIDGWAIGGVARDAGAPACKGAGVDLLVRVGQRVCAGDTLMRIHAADAATLAAIASDARAQQAIAIGVTTES